MVNDSSFSFDLTRKSCDAGFCLWIEVVILVGGECVGSKVCGSPCVMSCMSNYTARFWVSFVQPFLGIAVLPYWPQENVKHLFLFSSFCFSESLCFQSNLSPLLCVNYCFMSFLLPFWSSCELYLRSLNVLYRSFCMAKLRTIVFHITKSDLKLISSSFFYALSYWILQVHNPRRHKISQWANLDFDKKEGTCF